MATNSSIATAAKASTSKTATATAMIATVLFVSISSAVIVVATTKVKDALAFIAHTWGNVLQSSSLDVVIVVGTY